LGLPAREQNRELAAYARHELKQALQNISLSRRHWHAFPVPKMIDAARTRSSIDRAIKAGDARQLQSIRAPH